MEQTRRSLLTTVAAGTAAVAGCAAPTESGRQHADSPYTQLFSAISPAVVVVYAAENGQQVGQGSGFAIDPQTVVTNHHVIAPGSEIQIQLETGEWAETTVVGSDQHSDLAVLSVEDSVSFSESLSFVENTPPVGEEVIAVGAPFDLTDSLSRGVISGRQRSVPAESEFTIPDVVQTDAALNPGNSGGPLVDLDGRVVGVAFAGQGETVGFAISAALAQRVLPELREHGEYDHSYLGVTLQPIDPPTAEANDLETTQGVLVVDVLDDGPADGVLVPSDDPQLEVDLDPDAEEEEIQEELPDGEDLAPTGGDVIVAIGETAVADLDELSRTLALETRPGETVPITVIRDGEEQVVDLTLGTRPDEVDRA